jgi:hypothetical protein
VDKTDPCYKAMLNNDINHKAPRTRPIILNIITALAQLARDGCEVSLLQTISMINPIIGIRSELGYQSIVQLLHHRYNYRFVIHRLAFRSWGRMMTIIRVSGFISGDKCFQISLLEQLRYRGMTGLSFVQAG